MIRDYHCHYLMSRQAFLDGIIFSYQRPSTPILPWVLSLRDFIAATVCNNYWRSAGNLLSPKDQVYTCCSDFHSGHPDSQHTNYSIPHYCNIFILDTRKDSYIANPSRFHLNHFLVEVMMRSHFQKYHRII